MLTPSFGIGADVAQPSWLWGRRASRLPDGNPAVPGKMPGRHTGSQAYATLKRCVRGQLFFNRIDQLGDADRLGKKCVPLDLEAGLCLGFRYECGEKDDRRVMQFRVGLDSCRYFASVCLRHHDVEQNQVRPEIPGALMSPAGIVFFEYQIATCFFEKDFNQVSSVAVVINNQDASLFSDPESPPFGRTRPVASIRH